MTTAMNRRLLPLAVTMALFVAMASYGAVRYDAFLSPNFSASLTATNLTGHPALALKAGFLDGRPRALMITGRLFDEATVLRLGLAYEQATPWAGRHPSIG